MLARSAESPRVSIIRNTILDSQIALMCPHRSKSDMSLWPLSIVHKRGLIKECSVCVLGLSIFSGTLESRKPYGKMSGYIEYLLNEHTGPANFERISRLVLN